PTLAAKPSPPPPPETTAAPAKPAEAKPSAPAKPAGPYSVLQKATPPEPPASEASAPAKPTAPSAAKATAKPSPPKLPQPAAAEGIPGGVKSASAHAAEGAGWRSTSTHQAQGAGSWLGEGQRCSGEAEQDAKHGGSHAAAELFRSRALAQGSGMAKSAAPFLPIASPAPALPFKAAPTQSRPQLPPSLQQEPPYKAVPTAKSFEQPGQFTRDSSPDASPQNRSASHSNPTLLQSGKAAQRRRVPPAGEKELNPKVLREQSWASERLKPLLEFLGMAEELRGQSSLHCCQRVAERFNKEVLQLAEQLSSDRELARLFQTVASQHMGNTHTHEVRTTPSPILTKFLCMCLSYDSCAAVLTREDMMLKRAMISGEQLLASAMLAVAKEQEAAIPKRDRLIQALRQGAGSEVLVTALQEENY
ncbi:unnamed protein product, partial [Symbiodinium necroappetens]